MRIKHMTGEAFVPATYLVHAVNRNTHSYRNGRKKVTSHTVELTFNGENQLYLRFKTSALADAAYKRICKRVKGDY